MKLVRLRSFAGIVVMALRATSRKNHRKMAIVCGLSISE
jgi:hypothetical protein